MSLRRRLAAELVTADEVWVAAIVSEVRASMPSLISDAAIADFARDSTRALLQQFAALLTGEQPESDAYPAPEPALAFARLVARADASLAQVLRSYRVGQELVFNRAAELADDGDVASLREVGLLAFRYVDSVVGDVTITFEREREAVLRGSALRRERLIARLLAGDEPPQAEVERVLGWRMSGDHQALVMWAVEPGLDSAIVLANARRVLAEIAGDAGFMALQGMTGEVSAWIRVSAGHPLDPEDLAQRLQVAGLRAAVGGSAPGLAGFVASRRQAEAARGVASALPEAPALFHEDVALLSLLLVDAPASQRFATDELGALATAEQASLRLTVRTYLEAGQDATAAGVALGVHRNTVIRRLARAEELLGRPVGARVAETLVALRIRGG